eukprot:PhM_4_TR15703/c4_g3_i11/m.85064
MINSHDEHYPQMFRLGFHPTATRAAMLLRISNITSCDLHDEQAPANDYELCAFTTEDVLSFCVDTMQVLVVDITRCDGDDDYSHATVRTCLVLDDEPDNKDVAIAKWSQTTPPQHFVFAKMCFRRAINWVKRWPSYYDMNRRDGFSLHLFNTYNSSSVSTGDFFLSQCACLKFVDLSPLANVSEINCLFLADCYALSSLDLSPFSNVSKIGGVFLSRCCALTSLDLSPLSNVSEVGDNFLADCSDLTSLDLSPLSNVTAIGENFLCGCSGLTYLDLSPLTNVSRICDAFLTGCSALTSLDLSPLAHFSKIGCDLLVGCSGLTSLDFSPLVNVIWIGDDFLAGCCSLTSLDLSP